MVVYDLVFYILLVIIALWNGFGIVKYGYIEWLEKEYGLYAPAKIISMAVLFAYLVCKLTEPLIKY